MTWSGLRKSKISRAVILLSMTAAIFSIYNYFPNPESKALTKEWSSYQDFGNSGFGNPLLNGVVRTPSGSVILEQVGGSFTNFGTLYLNYNAGSIAKFNTLDFSTVENEGTTNVKARVRTALSQDRLSSAIFSKYYDDFPADISVSNNKWIQIEIYLETLDPNQTPVVQDGKLSYDSEKDEDPRRKFFPAPHPKDPKISLTSDGKPRITWSRLSGKDAEHLFNYIILKGFENYPVYGHPIAILSKSATQYIDYDVEPETTYRYYVRTMGEYNQTDDNHMLLEITTPKAPPKEIEEPPPLRLSADIKPIPIKVLALSNKKIAQQIENEAKTIFKDYFSKFQSVNLSERVNKLQKSSLDAKKVADSLKSKSVRANRNRYARLEVWQVGKDMSLVTSKVIRLNELGIGESKLYLKPGVYNLALYIPGSLRKLEKYVELGQSTNTINFVQNTDPYLTLGDFTGDGKINSLDFSYLAKRWSSNETEVDLNFDGIVNALDFAVIYKNWNKSDEIQ